MPAVFVQIIALCLCAAALPPVVSSQARPLPGRVVDIKVGEYFITAPDSIPAGLVTLRLLQTGDVTKPWPADTARLRADETYHFHMVWVVRLDSAKTFSDLFEAERDRRPTPWARILGGPGFADVPGTSNVTMHLTPGDYALVCYVGSARENRERYHLLKGMIRPLTVVASTGMDSMPAAELEIVVGGDSVQVPDTLDAREWRIRVRNDGERSTEFGISRLKTGFTLEQALAWRSRHMTEPPRRAVGGVVFIAPKQSLMTTVTLERGDYLFGRRHVVVR